MNIPNIVIPRGFLIASVALIGFSFAAIVAARIADAPTSPMPLPPVVESIDVAFADRADGAVLALDPSGSVRAVVAPETGGFVRGVLRALVRNRRENGLGVEAGSFRINRLADGHLTISDPATGETIDLGAFGPTNQASFAAIMTPGRVRTAAEREIAL